MDTEEFAVEHADDLAADLVGVAMGIELFLDIGAGGPFPEEFFKGVLAFGFFEGQAFLFELEAAGNQVAAAEGHDVQEELAEEAEFGFGVVGGGKILSRGGEAEGNPMDEVVDDGFAGGLVWSGVIGLSFGGELEGGLAHLPAAKRALAIIREVLFADGFSVEIGLEDGLEFGEGVKPEEEGFGGLIVVEPGVELLAESVRETGEFA